ncbi:hypothetical protein RCL_jg12145.t1 [Rhizophagus clarus]|nr:hypothetical protein RCL_jg12145.t1 [Rhizophagus clarus]
MANQAKKTETSPQMDEYKGFINHLNHLLMKTTKKNIGSYITHFLTSWLAIKIELQVIARKVDSTIELPDDIHPKALLNNSKVKYNYISNTFQNKQIKKKQRVIIMDRLLYHTNSHQELITDPIKIRRLTNNHFQHCADDKLILAISALQLEKATGPSGISNEMLKHLSSNMLSIFIRFLNCCLMLNDIPPS